MTITISIDNDELASKCKTVDCPLASFRRTGMTCFFDKPCRLISSRDWKRLREWDKLGEYGIVFTDAK